MIIGTKEMAELYGKPSVAAFYMYKKRNPEKVPVPTMGKAKWLREDVETFLREKPWLKKSTGKNTGRKRTSGKVELRVG